MRKAALGVAILSVLAAGASAHAAVAEQDGRLLLADAGSVQNPATKRSLSVVVKDYNTAMKNVGKKVNAMQSDADHLDPQKQAEVEAEFAIIRSTLEEMKQHKTSILSQAQGQYEDTYKRYKERIAEVEKRTAAANSAPQSMGSASAGTSGELTGEDQRLLGKFRTNYIGYDFEFRNIDPAEVKFSAGRTKYEKMLSELRGYVDGVSVPNHPKTEEARAKYQKLADNYQAALAAAGVGAADNASNGDATPEQFLADVSVLIEGREPIKQLHRDLENKTKYLPGNYEGLKGLFDELAPRFDLSNNAELKKIIETHELFGRRYGTTRKEISASAKALYGSEMLELSNGSRMDIASVYLGMDEQIQKIVDMRPQLAERITHSIKSSLANVSSLDSTIRLRVIDEKTEELKLAMAIDPECKSAQSLLSRMPELKAEVANNIEEQYDNARFVVEVKNWGGPLSISEVKSAINAFLQKQGSKPLKIGIAGQWQPNRKDLLGRPIDHQIPFYVAYADPNNSNNVLVQSYGAVTDGSVKALPIVRLQPGYGYIMRKKNL